MENLLPKVSCLLIEIGAARHVKSSTATLYSLEFANPEGYKTNIQPVTQGRQSESSTKSSGTLGGGVLLRGVLLSFSSSRNELCSVAFVDSLHRKDLLSISPPPYGGSMSFWPESCVSEDREPEALGP